MISLSKLRTLSINATKEDILKEERHKDMLLKLIAITGIVLFVCVFVQNDPAAAIGLGWFIYKLVIRIVDGMESKLDAVDEKVEGQIAAIEERLGTKLDAQHGILVALIDRVRSLDNEIIRQDTLIKTILGVPQLINSNKIAKAERDDQRKD